MVDDLRALVEELKKWGASLVVTKVKAWATELTRQLEDAE